MCNMWKIYTYRIVQELCIMSGVYGCEMYMKMLLVQNERATGYGVALLTALFGSSSDSALLRSLATTELSVVNGDDCELASSPSSATSSNPKKLKVG